ncbi:hypothetical protein BH11PSE8_BH11PSE8_31110 [soil metagenome]
MGGREPCPGACENAFDRAPADSAEDEALSIDRNAEALRDAHHPAPPARWTREAGAGALGQLITIAPVLTLGLLAYAPLGSVAVQVGMPASFVASALGGVIFARVCGSGMPTAGPSSACAVILAALVAQLAGDSQLTLANPAHLAQIVAVVSICGMATGVLQMVFGTLRMGSLAKFVPQPVLAGFMNGVALLMLLAQVPQLLGIGSVQVPIWQRWAQVQPGTALIGLGTIGMVWLVAWRRPGAPAVLIAMVLGSLAYAALGWVAPGWPLGPRVGALPDTLALPTAWHALAGQPFADGGVVDLLWRHSRTVLLDALVLAIIASLDSILGAVSIGQTLGSRTEPNRQLLAHGLANVAVGAFGGVPLVYSRSRAIAIVRAGGRSWRAALAGPLLMIPFLLWGGPVVDAIGRIPLAVLAGIMATVAIGLMDGWTHRLVQQWLAGDRARELRASLVVVAVVCAVTLWLGFIEGVAAGVMLSMLLFITAMNRSLLRAQHSGAARPSRRVYPLAQEQVLATLRWQIVVLELEGALFFGSADRLAIEVERLAAAHRFLVLDLKRVTMIDASGAVQLEQLAARLRGRGVALWLAGASADNRHGLALRAFGTYRAESRGDWFADADHATEAAELRMLASAGHPIAHRVAALDESLLVQGLTAAQRSLVRTRLRPQRLAAGEYLFREGDVGDGLYVLIEGSITVLSQPLSPEGLPQRFVSFSPSMMLGEMAMLDGRGRTADARADVASLVYGLSKADLAALGEADAGLIAQLYRNMALHLAERLRVASAAWRAA